MSLSPSVIERFLAGAPTRELAAQIGMTPGSLRVALHRLGLKRGDRSFNVETHAIRVQGGCLLFKNCVAPNGYGRLTNSQYAHRVAWESVHGPIPKGLTIDHLCNRRSCVNPDHMRLVEQSENARRRVRGAFYRECRLRESLGLPVHYKNAHEKGSAA